MDDLLKSVEIGYDVLQRIFKYSQGVFGAYIGQSYDFLSWKGMFILP